MTPHNGPWAGEADVLLLCLDTLKDGDRALPPPSERDWAAKAARILSHARRNGWIIVHAVRGRASDRARWRALEGLMPLPFERVLHRDPPSAFGARGLAEVVKPGGRMVAVGCSADSAMLLTFRDAMSRQLRVAAPTDAIQVPTAERAQIAALAAQGVDPEGGRFVLQTTARLLGTAPPLRVIEGGVP